MTASSTQIPDMLASLYDKKPPAEQRTSDPQLPRPTDTELQVAQQTVQPVTPTTPPPSLGLDSAGSTPAVERSFWITGTDNTWRNVKLSDFPRAATVKNGDSTVIFLERQTVDPATKEANNRAVLRQLGVIADGMSSEELQPLVNTIARSGPFSSEPPKGKASLALFTVDPVTKSSAISYIPLTVDTGHRPDQVDRSTNLGVSVTLNGSDAIPFGGAVQFGSTETRVNFKDQVTRTSLLIKGGLPETGVGVSRVTEVPHDHNGQTYRSDREVLRAEVSAVFPLPLSVYAGLRYEKSHTNSSGERVTDLSVEGTIRPTGPGASITTENEKIKLQAMYNNLNLFGVPVSAVVPGLWGMAVTVKGSDTPWIIDKASGSWVSYQGSDGKPGFHFGAAGLGPVGLPFIVPGEGAMPDRVIKLPQVAVEAMTAADVAKVGLDMISSRQVQRVSALAKQFMQENPSTPVVFFPAEAGINALSVRDISQFPALAKNFERVTGVPAVSNEGVQLTREQIKDEVWKWFQNQNQDLLTHVSKGLSSENPVEKMEAQRNLAALREFATEAVATPLIPSPDDCRKMYEGERRAKPTVPARDIPWEEINKPRAVSQRNPYLDKFELQTEQVVDVVAGASAITGKDGRKYILSQTVLSIDVADESKKRSFEPRTTERTPMKRTQLTIEELQPIADGVPEEVAVKQAKDSLKQRELSVLQTAHNIMAEAWRQNRDLDDAAARVGQALQPSGLRVLQDGQSPGDRRRELLQQVTRTSR